MASRRDNQQLLAPGWGLAFGVFSSLPLVETLVYDAHVGSGRSVLSVEEYVLVGLLVLLLVGIHALCFLIPQGVFRSALERFLRKLEASKKRLRENLVYVLLALPVLFLVVFFGGEAGTRLLVESGALGTVLLPLVLLAVVAALVWGISKVLSLLASGLAHDLGGAMNEWAFSVRVSMVFYVLLVAATFRLVSLEGIRPAARLEFTLGIAKDYLLMFIIAGMLFTGLFKIGSARSLKALFQTQRGFLQFMLICVVIAILAIWADFNGMSPENQEKIFLYEWQKQLNRVHVYVRDVGLLLMPIAALLFWSLRSLSEEVGTSEA